MDRLPKWLWIVLLLIGMPLGIYANDTGNPAVSGILGFGFALISAFLIYCLSRLWSRLTRRRSLGEVGEPQSEAQGPLTISGRTGELPEDPRRSRIS